MQTLNFLFNNTELRIYGTVEQPIFVVNDICEIIEIDNKSRMIMRNKKRKQIQGLQFAGPQFPQYRGQDLAIVNERGLYEIMFRSNSKLCEQFKDEICEFLNQQRLQKNIIHQQKILELEQRFEIEKQQLNQKIIDQQIQHEQELENRERIYSVITIHKVDYDFDPEDDEEDFDIISCPQIICVSKNPYQIFIDYTTKLNNHYKQELNYYYVVLQDKLKKEEALQFKNDYLNNVFGCNRQQHHSRQWVTPLNE
ncbi:hypothetical protein ABPG72_008343 [Tetrahymena utriculariae]